MTTIWPEPSNTDLMLPTPNGLAIHKMPPSTALVPHVYFDFSNDIESLVSYWGTTRDDFDTQAVPICKGSRGAFTMGRSPALDDVMINIQGAAHVRIRFDYEDDFSPLDEKDMARLASVLRLRSVAAAVDVEQSAEDAFSIVVQGRQGDRTASTTSRFRVTDHIEVTAISVILRNGAWPGPLPEDSSLDEMTVIDMCVAYVLTSHLSIAISPNTFFYYSIFGVPEPMVEAVVSLWLMSPKEREWATLMLLSNSADAIPKSPMTPDELRSMISPCSGVYFRADGISGSTHITWPGSEDYQYDQSDGLYKYTRPGHNCDRKAGYRVANQLSFKCPSVYQDGAFMFDIEHVSAPHFSIGPTEILIGDTRILPVPIKDLRIVSWANGYGLGDRGGELTGGGAGDNFISHRAAARGGLGVGLLESVILQGSRGPFSSEIRWFSDRDRVAYIEVLPADTSCKWPSLFVYIYDGQVHSRVRTYVQSSSPSDCFISFNDHREELVNLAIFLKSTCGTCVDSELRKLIDAGILEQYDIEPNDFESVLGRLIDDGYSMIDHDILTETSTWVPN